MPPQRVIWNLSYPTGTNDQLATFRHHYETLRLDQHVASISCEERADVPNLMTMRVEFAEGFERPDNQELRFADALYPSQMRHLERDIQVREVTPEQVRSVAELMETFRTEMRAHPTYDRLAETMRQTRAPETVTIPKWIVVGRAYRSKLIPANVRTLKAVRVQPTGTVVLECEMDMPNQQKPATVEHTLEEFVRTFEPYQRPALPRTSWTRVLEDDAED